MKRDMKLVRYLLFLLEDRSDASVLTISEVAGYTKDEVQYHFNLMYEAELISAEPVRSSTSDRVVRVHPFCLTWNGHELLDTIRDDSIFNATLERLKSIGGKAAISVLTAVATKLALAAVTT